MNPIVIKIVDENHLEGLPGRETRIGASDSGLKTEP